MQTTIVLVRHGQTEWNKNRRVQGITDIPLSEEGKKQAQFLAARLENLGISVVYSSVLKRAFETAEIATKELNIPIQTDPRLNERSYGDHEGKLIDEVHQQYWTMHKKLLATPPNGESYLDFDKRVITAFHEIIEKEHGKTLLIVCHGGVLHVLIRHLKKIPHNQETDFKFPNTSISIFHIQEEEYIEEVIADSSHLE